MKNVAIICQLSQPTSHTVASTEELCDLLASKYQNMYVTTTCMYACLLEDIT